MKQAPEIALLSEYQHRLIKVGLYVMLFKNIYLHLY